MCDQTASAEDIARWEEYQDSPETYAAMLRVWSRTLTERKRQLQKERAEDGQPEE